MKHITYFQAANLTDAEIRESFIVRQREFDRVMAEVRRDKMKGSIQHYIFVGQRGSGKSTLLRRIEAEINTEPELNKRLVAVNLSEEQAGIYRLHDLWDKVCQALSQKGLEVNEPDWNDYREDLPGYSAKLYEALQEALKNSNKKLVLLLDNIDRILESIGHQESHALRELLTNHKDLRIIGGSTKLSEHYWEYKKPFYEFFQIVRLEPLTNDEMKELFHFWAEHKGFEKLKEIAEKHPGRLEAVRILTDGMPRTMLLFAELLLENPERQGYEYLMKILDKGTSIYQERLGTLSPAQQKVLVELSFFWQAASVKELAYAARMESKTVSGLLKQLVEQKIVTQIKSTNKNHLYRLSERFFNLWLIMTQGGPRQKSELKGLTVFLETFYDKEDLQKLYKKTIKNLSRGMVGADKALILVKALAHSSFISIAQRDILLQEFKSTAANNQELLDFLPLEAATLLGKAQEHIHNQNFRKAALYLNKIEQQDGRIEVVKGRCYYNVGDIVESKNCFLNAMSMGVPDANLEFAELCFQAGKLEEAESIFKEWLAKGNKRALYGMAQILSKRGQYDLAESYYLKAAEKRHENALTSLALSYLDQGKTIEAEKMFAKAWKNGERGAAEWISEIAYAKNSKKESESEEFSYFMSAPSENIVAEFSKIVFSLWLGKPDEVLRVTQSFSVLNEEFSLIFDHLFSEILVHHQTQQVWTWFNSQEYGPNLKTHLLPIYFATAHLIESDAAREVVLSQPPELNETVSKIVAEIQERREYYYGPKK